MAIRLAGADINDIRVMLNGTLTPVNAVKIGGAATNIWPSVDTWDNGIWTDQYGQDYIYNEDSGRFVREYDGQFLYYDRDHSVWNLKPDDESWTLWSHQPKTATRLDMLDGAGTTIFTLTWRAE